MNGAAPDIVIRNLESIGLTSKYNSGSLAPMGTNGPVANPFLGISEPGAAFLSPVVRGGKRKNRKTSTKRKHKKRSRKTRGRR